VLQGWLSPLIRKHADAAGDPVADGELLARYADDRDESAFELLVWRHAALVAGVCQRILRDHHRAEDAFQAAFLVLARKAGSVRGNLGGWLFRVARRIALRAKQSAERTAAREVPLIDEAAREESITSIERTELLAILDEEVAGLPERFRLPVLLCYLGGNSTGKRRGFSVARAERSCRGSPRPANG
jgi:RNA polymerase sigma factor (sigma-70 family)